MMKIGSHKFEDVDYDVPGDILYLWNGDEGGIGRSADGRLTDTWFYREDTDDLVGVMIFHVALRLQRDGVIYVTLPEGERLRLEGLEELVAKETKAFEKRRAESWAKAGQPQRAA
jgi:hypothetical protein